MYLPFLGTSQISEQARSHWTGDQRHGGTETVAQTGGREATRKISISLRLFELFAESASIVFRKIARCFRAVSAALDVCWTLSFPYSQLDKQKLDFICFGGTARRLPNGPRVLLTRETVQPEIHNEN
jgi:hypothetical protein